RQGKIATGRRQRDLADKESRRWLELARASAATLQAADLLTVMGDRESDIYALFAAPRPTHVHLLVRAAQDRNLAEGARLLAHADGLCEQHRYTIEVPEKGGSKRRTATVAVGFGRVQIARPARMTCGNLPDAVAMTLVAVREVDAPEDAEPVRWVLLTTH